MNSLQRKTIYGDHYYHLEFVIIRMTESIKHQEEFEPRIVDNMPNKSRQAHYYNKQDSYKMSIISDRFLSLYTVAITVHRLIRENASSTKRGLYYMHAGLFQDQKIVDSAAGRSLLLYNRLMQSTFLRGLIRWACVYSICLPSWSTSSSGSKRWSAGTSPSSGMQFCVRTRRTDSSWLIRN